MCPLEDLVGSLHVRAALKLVHSRSASRFKAALVSFVCSNCMCVWLVSSSLLVSGTDDVLLQPHSGRSAVARFRPSGFGPGIQIPIT